MSKIDPFSNIEEPVVSDAQAITKMEEVRLTCLCCDLLDTPGNLENRIHEDFYDDPPTDRLVQASKILLTLVDATNIKEAAAALITSKCENCQWVGKTLQEVLEIRE